MSETIPRVAILASGDRESGGGGSTAERIVRDVLEQKVGFQIGAVICNNPEGSVGVYPKIEALNDEFGLKGDDRIDVEWIGPANYPGGKLKRGQRLEESAAICRLLEERDIDFVQMAGYLRILTGELVETWAWQPEFALDPVHDFRQGLYHPDARIGNNHPAILPLIMDKHGHEAHEKAIQLYGEGVIKYTAMTWHMASPEVDKGPIIHEIPVNIDPSYDADALSDAVQAVEKEQTSKVLERHLILRAEHLRANSLGTSRTSP